MRRTALSKLALHASCALAWLALAGCADGRASEAPAPTRRARAPDPPPSFAEDVAPILHGSCAGCHRPAGPAPLSLLTYEQAAPLAERIADVTASGRMPPWLPAPDVDFEGERRLSEAQIATLRRWAEAGAPAGDLSEAPEPPEWTGGWRLGRPDLVIEAPEAVVVEPGSDEAFRNLVLPVPLDRGRWVRAVELRPGSHRVVHHATMMVDSTPSSRILAAREPGPGFDGMHAGSDARPPGGFLLGWTPGRVPAPAPEGLAWRLEPATDFIVQLHLRPGAEPATVRPAVGFHFTDEPPLATPFVLRLTDETIDIPAGDTAYAISDEYRLPVDVVALGIYPHAHYLGDRMEAWADLPDGRRRPLLTIEDWDFNWQDAYRYEEPVPLPAGTWIRMRYTYDNSASNPQNPHDSPRRVVYGPRSTDEMGELWIQVVPEDDGALATLARDFGRKDFLARVEGWQHAVEVWPDESRGYYGLGTVLQGRGRLDEAIAYLERAVEVDSSFAQARYNLALALQRRGEEGDLETAIRHLREAVRLYPEHANAHNNLGNALRETGRTVEALRHYRRAVGLDPDHAFALNNLGTLLRAAGHRSEAVSRLREAIRVRPRYSAPRFNLALALAEAGRPEEALRSFRAGAELQPDAAPAYVALAWLLSTRPDPAARRPEAARRLAERAVALTERRNARALDVLAAAHAALGDFAAAARTAEEALALASATGQPALAAEIRGHLERFRQRRDLTEGGGRP